MCINYQNKPGQIEFYPISRCFTQYAGDLNSHYESWKYAKSNECGELFTIQIYVLWQPIAKDSLLKKSLPTSLQSTSILELGHSVPLNRSVPHPSWNFGLQINMKEYAADSDNNVHFIPPISRTNFYIVWTLQEGNDGDKRVLTEKHVNLVDPLPWRI